MSSSAKTVNGLNIWSKSDIPKMADFNSDNTLIDAAITKAENPLAQIGEGGITSEYLADGAVGFGNISIRDKSGSSSVLAADANGAPLYVCGGENIKVLNWSQGDSYQQLCIEGENILSYYAKLPTTASGIIDNIALEGIFAVKPKSDLGNMPEKVSDTAILINFKPYGATFLTQLWLGDGLFRRDKSSGSWSVWKPASGNGSGNLSERPAAPKTGEMYFDTQLGLPLWWNGNGWVKADGTAA